MNAGGPRGQIIDVKRPWARFNYNPQHWNVLGYYNGRESESRNITTGAPFELDADTFSGSVRSDVPVTLRSVGRTNGERRGSPRAIRGTYGDASAVLAIRSHSGSVVITKK